MWRIKLLAISSLLCVFLFSCSFPWENGGQNPPEEKTTGHVPKFFWGSWVRMDGVNEEWYINDSKVSINGSEYSITNSDLQSLNLSIGSLTKKSENMITLTPGNNADEFYLFRKYGATSTISGGVQVAENIANNASPSITRSLAGIGSIEVILENQLNIENIVETTTDTDGNLIFDDIIVNDDYTVTIPVQEGVDEIITFEINPEYDGESIGYITLNNADQNFKVQYSMSTGDKWGFYYAGKTYNLDIAVNNIGSADLLSADYTITPQSGMNLTGDSLQDILGTVRANGGSKKLSYTITVDSFSEEYKDFEIPIEIKSLDGHVWKDKISLRFFRETMSIHIASHSNEVQGILISPNRVSFPFKTVNLRGSIEIPFLSTGYVLALCGANYDSETKYAMCINTTPVGDGASLTSAALNEPNNTELEGTEAFIDEEYLGYLGVYDLDFFTIHNYSRPELRYTISFDTQGGSPVSPLSVVANSIASEPPAPVLNGFGFEGWYTDQSYINKWDFTSDVVSTDIVLYAKWEQYTVSFDAQGGSAISSIVVPSGEQIPSNISTTFDGYLFDGWFLDSEYTTVWNISEDVVTQDITLYAKWTPIYSVTFISAGGSDVPSQFVAAGSLIVEPAFPSRTGYVFDGWYIDDQYLQEWKFAEDLVNTNIILYAKWRRFRVDFNTQGGNLISSVYVQPGERISKPSDPVRLDYLFGGWYHDASCTEKWDFVQDTVNTDMTLYAKWYSEVAKVESNGWSSFILTMNSELWGTGSNTYGQLCDETLENKSRFSLLRTNIKDISTTGVSTLFLSIGGDLYAAGYNSSSARILGSSNYGSIITPELIMSSVETISMSNTHSLILKTDKSLWGVGSNYNGALGIDFVPMPGGLVALRKLSDSVEGIMAGNDASAILKANGALNTSGILNQIYYEHADKYRFIGPRVENIISIDIDTGRHFLYLNSSGRLYGLGGNTYGEQGNGTTDKVTEPTLVMSNVQQFSVGNGFVLAVQTDGTLWGWGRNLSGQFGIGVDELVYTPVKLLSNISAAYVGMCSYVIKEDGTVWSTGRNTYGVLGDGTEIDKTDIVKVYPPE